MVNHRANFVACQILQCARHAGKAFDGPVKFWAQESWKAGAGIRLSNFRSWKAGDAPENLNFWEFYDIMKG